jgi:hypothetical protein
MFGVSSAWRLRREHLQFDEHGADVSSMMDMIEHDMGIWRIVWACPV